MSFGCYATDHFLKDWQWDWNIFDKITYLRRRNDSRKLPAFSFLIFYILWHHEKRPVITSYATFCDIIDSSKVAIFDLEKSVTYRVIIWKCILNKRLTQICIEEHRQTLYIVWTPRVGHFTCSTNWLVTYNDCRAAGAQSDTLDFLTGAAPVDVGFPSIFHCLSLSLLRLRNAVMHCCLQLGSVIVPCMSHLGNWVVNYWARHLRRP